jgi:hypothetical protein
MSAEEITISKNNNAVPFQTPKKSNPAIQTRVNINDLIARVKKEERKESKQNLVLFCLLSSFVAIMGIILAY